MFYICFLLVFDVALRVHCVPIRGGPNMKWWCLIHVEGVCMTVTECHTFARLSNVVK